MIPEAESREGSGNCGRYLRKAEFGQEGFHIY